MRRLIEKMKPKRPVKLLLATILMSGICIMPTFAADAFVGTHDAGTDKTFTVTETGTYEFDLYGSKGGDYGSYTGGKGGRVKFTMLLNKGDTIQIVTGNTSGIGGGGAGTASNGGGATYVKVNDTLVGVAGGGGGATSTKSGGAGGATAGTNGTTLEGSSHTKAVSAGGGSGYVGGKAGHYHAHSGSNSSGTGCYKGGKTYTKTETKDGKPCTETHYHGSGSSQTWHHCCECCPSCNHNHDTTTTVTYYYIACGNTAENIASYGGTNYIASSCRSINNISGQNNTLGKATIKLLTTITYDLNKPANADQEPVYANGLTITNIYKNLENSLSDLPDAYLYGYDFIGWFTEPTGGTKLIEGEIAPITGAYATVYAHWEPKTINITLNYGEAEISEKVITRKYAEAYDLETPSYIGISFTGWYTDLTAGTQVNNKDTVRSDTNIILYAHWEIPTYTLNFNPNGGTCNVVSKQVTNLQLVGELPTATRNGYFFTGWYTEKNDGELITENTLALFTDDTTLYAHWQLRDGWEFPYTGTYDYFNAPVDGYYRLEVWGAQGGNYSKYTGGKGGYATQVVWLNKGDVLQVNVGGQASTFNGGGTGTISAGGGSTDFRFSSSSNYSNDSRIIIAGGGGGATSGQNGGDGGTTDSGNNGVLLAGSSSISKKTAGGGGGYYGGKAGHYHAHTGSRDNGGGCYTVSRSGSKTEEVKCPGKVRPVQWDCTECSSGIDSQCDECGAGYHGEANRSCWHSTTKTVSYTYYDLGCGEKAENVQSKGGSNYTATTFNSEKVYLTEKKSGERSGNGYVKVTKLYTMLLDTSVPTIEKNYEVDASNLAFIDNEDTLIDETNLPFTTPNFAEFKDKQTGIEGQSAFGLMLVEKGTTYGKYEKLPVPSLKGWKFLGWYTEPQIDKGTQVIDTSAVSIKDDEKVLKNPVLYAHWQEETYYIKYYKANTNLNIYNDEITNPEAVFDTTLASKSETKLFRYDATEDCYIQTVKYDHDISVLPNYYAKTGYYFKNWTNTADTTLKGTVGIGTGTGKQTGKTYYESEILKQNKVGEQFLETFGNFNYITNEKEMALDPTIEPVWSYGSDTVIMYATWEPIKYQLRFNGTNNWNEEQASYLQNVVDSTGKQSTTIRYDQIFTLDANKFTRNAPYTITSPDGLPVTLKTGYSWIGWGFGKPTMKYSTPSWNLTAVNTEYDPDQALVDLTGITGRDYVNQQASVKNVISTDGIKAIEKYISDWSNTRTDSNRADKTELDTKVIESNLHSLWRRNAKGDEPIDPDNPPVTPPGDGPDPDDPDDDNFGITITFDLNGGEWLDTKTNKPTTEPIVLKQELFNEYYYEFNIIGNTNTDLLNKSVIFDAYGKKSNTNPLQNYDNATGLNYTFRKSDEQGNKYRFCGWSLEQGQISADYNATIDGITKYNFDTYDATKNSNTIKVANDLTLYAIWEPELTLNVHLYRKLGGSTKISGSLTNANQATVKAKGIPEVMIKPGEEGRYLITLNTLNKGTVTVMNDAGESVYLYRPIDVEVTFDPVMTGIYDFNSIAIKDNLNVITSADGTEPVLKTSALNRKITEYKDSSLARNFHIPTYLGTTIAESNGYPSFKAEGYDLNITASRYSNFHKGTETVTAEFKIKTTKDAILDDGSGTGGTGTGDNGGTGSGSTPTSPSGIGNTLDELRTKLKIKLH